jgi:hypothetical protein
MTPKEKAKELTDEINSANKHINYIRAKTIALICVDEIVTELGIVYRSISATSILFMIGYWREVEQEINKL